MATIDKFVELDFDPDKAVIADVDFAGLDKLFKELELKTMRVKACKYFNYNPDLNAKSDSQSDNISSGEENSPKEYDAKKVNYKLVTEISDAEELTSLLANSKEFVFDTETDSLNIFRAKIAGVAFAVRESEAWFVALQPENQIEDMFSNPKSDRLPLSEFKRIFSPVFANPEIKKICQNGKYDIAILRTAGISLRGFYFDTMVASYVLDPDKKHGMDDLAATVLNYSTIHLSTLIGEKKDASKIFDVDKNALQQLKGYWKRYHQNQDNFDHQAFR